MIIQNNKHLKNIDFKNEKELQSYVKKTWKKYLVINLLQQNLVWETQDWTLWDMTKKTIHL